MPIKPPSFSGGTTMFNPIMYGGVQRRSTPPEEAFDKLLDAYAHSHRQELRSLEHGVIRVDDVRQMFVTYVSHFEGFYRSVSQALNEHMNVCTSPPPFFAEMRTRDLRSQFSQGYVVNADRRSGKTTALFDEADEVSKATSSHITIIALHKEYVLAEMCRRRLDHATPGQFNRLDVISEDELHKLNGMGGQVMVDEWWSLSERTRQELSSGRFTIMAAVGTVPHGARIPISNHAVRDEAGYRGIRPEDYSPIPLAHLSKDRG